MDEEVKNTEEQAVESKKDLFLKRLREKYPEEAFDDDEAVYGKIHADYDQYDQQLSDYKGREESLTKMFSENPKSAEFLKRWRDGGDPVIALIEQFGTEIKNAIDDPAKQEEIAEANKKYIDMIASSKDLEDQYEKNLAQSMEDLKGLSEEMGLSDEEIESAMNLLQTISTDFILGKITPETMKIAFKAISHDADVEQARREGEVAGKNAKIEEKLKGKKGAEDLPPDLGGRSGGVPEPPKSFGAALDKYGPGRKGAWDAPETRTSKRH